MRDLPKIGDPVYVSEDARGVMGDGMNSHRKNCRAGRLGYFSGSETMVNPLTDEEFTVTCIQPTKGLAELGKLGGTYVKLSDLRPWTGWTVDSYTSSLTGRDTHYFQHHGKTVWSRWSQRGELFVSGKHISAEEVQDHLDRFEDTSKEWLYVCFNTLLALHWDRELKNPDKKTDLKSAQERLAECMENASRGYPEKKWPPTPKIPSTISEEEWESLHDDPLPF